MNSNWRNRPTSIDYISLDDVDYFVFIDESGTSNLQPAINAIKNSTDLEDANERHFNLTAVLFDKNSIESARDSIMALKYRYWPDGKFNYPKGFKRVHFHSRDIRHKKGPFSETIIDYSSFVRDLGVVMEGLPMRIYAAHIDKIFLVKQYVYPRSPYDLGINFLLERVIKDIPANSRIIVVFESRNKDDDKRLLHQVKAMLDNGNLYHGSVFFSPIKGIYFNSKWCQKDSDQTSYWELEVTDLCAYPIAKFFNYGTKDKAFLFLEQHIACFPNYMGRGLKNFP